MESEKCTHAASLQGVNVEVHSLHAGDLFKVPAGYCHRAVSDSGTDVFIMISREYTSHRLTGLS
ncbi:MAG: hypothetical protein MHM6MM_001919 [Cercozoa sp. M6MM]